jgi:hypothetical protein
MGALSHERRKLSAPELLSSTPNRLSSAEESLANARRAPFASGNNDGDIGRSNPGSLVRDGPRANHVRNVTT